MKWKNAGSSLKMRLLWLVLMAALICCVAATPGLFSSLFGRNNPSSTAAPRLFGSNSRCSASNNQCAYECCNSGQTCLRNRCFPRIANCPVTRDQCANTCCRASEICRNGVCSR
ncbi:unnamed protein product [Caenorhabditis auriculariae]|uniref:WAP domain-containing protein n=1 Tax=Caenorhabditis auriculariae TaxID=2777116 RepID=A0A8S1GXZ3_9PELO|nr:unnamed protein product [Caenorhabditis auriculariae]